MIHPMIYEGLIATINLQVRSDSIDTTRDEIRSTASRNAKFLTCISRLWKGQIRPILDANEPLDVSMF